VNAASPFAHGESSELPASAILLEHVVGDELMLSKSHAPLGKKHDGTNFSAHMARPEDLK